MAIQAAMQFYSVGAVVRYLRDMLEFDEQLQDLWVRGEVSQFTNAASGHWYFNLKDDEGLLRCVIYRQRNAGLPRLSPGQEIFAHGKMTLYPPRGEMQLTVDQIEDVGVGALYQRFLALKEELEELGLFEVERKRPIPVSPAAIGLVTSADAAALRDIIRTLRLRWPLARVLLAPTLVQGDKAPQQIVQALAHLNQHAGAEVIVIARGGGSIEDLWAFNDRAVALAIANSRIPTVTGIGHETDFTIADFVADLRAATPTAAAVAVSPDITGLRALVDDGRLHLLSAIHDRLDQQRDDLSTALHRLEREHPRAQHDRARQQLAEAVADLRRQLAHRLALEHERLSGAALRLQSLSPLLTMARGYAAITRDRDSAPVASIADVAPPEAITLRLRDGEVGATVTTTRPLAEAAGGGPSAV
jgi:exodeoxyribonuclease VII large subunit